MYEVVEYAESKDRLGQPPTQRRLGVFAAANEALERGREAWRTAVASGTDDYMWWVVKRQGAELAEWIADSRSAKEFAVDLRTGQLIEI
jgi:hypothetical protein